MEMGRQGSLYCQLHGDRYSGSLELQDPRDLCHPGHRCHPGLATDGITAARQEGSHSSAPKLPETPSHWLFLHLSPLEGAERVSLTGWVSGSPCAWHSIDNLLGLPGWAGLKVIVCTWVLSEYRNIWEGAVHSSLLIPDERRSKILITGSSSKVTS